jgi:hypothetical protein
MNGRIRKIQSRGYGYKDVEHLDLKILTCMLPESPPLTVDLEEFFGLRNITRRLINLDCYAYISLEKEKSRY